MASTGMVAAYHHYGMISPFKVARDLVRNSSNGARKFFDEFMTWRELSYAFCFQHWPDLESMQVSSYYACPPPLPRSPEPTVYC